MNKIINIGQIGVGYWGPNLLRNLVSNKRCSVKKVAELSGERRDYIRSQYNNVIVTEDANEILNDSHIHAVIIATPASTHYDLAKRALLSGKHVLVEKPIVTNSAQLRDLESIASANKLVVMVGHTFLFNPAVNYLKKVISSGEVGKIRYIYCTRLNLGRIRKDVNAFWNFAPHDISIIQYILGNIKPLDIHYKGMSYVQDGIDDVSFVNITYPEQILVNIHVSWLDPKKVREVVVVGSEKMIIYDDVSDNKITIYDKGIDCHASIGSNMDYDSTNLSFKHRFGDIHIPKIDSTEPLKLEIDHFFDCIESNTDCITGIPHAISVIEILENANKFSIGN